MHKTIGFVSRRLVQIRPGEGRKVLLTFLYFFLVITAYYVIKPVSRSLVLGDLGSRMVPYIDLICALLMGPIVTLFARCVDRMEKPRLVSLSFWVIIAVLLGFWQLLQWPMPWIAGAFYVWVAIFSVLVVTLFWLVANDLYRPRDAKRLFGFIGSGGILGGIVGSSIAAAGAQLIGTERLLLLSAGLLVVCWWVVGQLWQFSPERIRSEEAAPTAHHETFLTDMRSFARLLLQSRYLLLLVALVAINKIIATLIYYQLNPFIELTFPDQDAKTAFVGMFFGGMNVLAFVIQFFFTSWMLRRFGLSVALLMLPVGVLAGSVGLFAFPALWLAAGTELYDGSMNYSLQQTTKEVLYLPIDRSIRYKVKPFIDMVVFRFGKGIAAIVGIVLLDALGVPARWLSLIAIPLLIAWIVVAIQLRRDYIATIRTVLQARAAARRKPDARDAREPAASRAEAAVEQPLDAFGPLTDGHPSSRKLTLMDRLIGSDTPSNAHTKELMARLTAYETHVSPASEVASETARLKAILCDQNAPIAKRRQAIRLLARSPHQTTVDYLFGIAMVESDMLLRQEAVKGLVKLRVRASRLEFPVRQIRRQIAAEVANYQRVHHVASIYRQHHHGTLPPDDPIVELLRALMEESVEQIFRFLMLLYRPEDIHLIYEQMQAPDAYLRSDAIELLDNLVDPAMRVTLYPILDEDRFLTLLDEGDGALEPTAAYRMLQDAIWDHNCWLSVTTLCAVGRLRLTTMRQELEKASQHTMPLISTAAKVALHLSTLS